MGTYYFTCGTNRNSGCGYGETSPYVAAIINHCPECGEKAAPSDFPQYA